jgi:hypothetical protein
LTVNPEFSFLVFLKKFEFCSFSLNLWFFDSDLCARRVKSTFGGLAVNILYKQATGALFYKL